MSFFQFVWDVISDSLKTTPAPTTFPDDSAQSAKSEARSSEIQSRPYLQYALEPLFSAGASIDDLQLGDHVYTYRTIANLYTHHGIYVGEGLIIHYGGLSRNGSSSRIDYIGVNDFRRENGEERKIFIAKYQGEPKFTRTEIVERAKSRVGENEYNVLWENCEHFATWCVTDEAKCYQLGDKNNPARF